MKFALPDTPKTGFLATKPILHVTVYVLFQPSVRKTHCSGRKHKENVRLYYQKWLEEQVQKLVDDTSKFYIVNTRFQILNIYFNIEKKIKIME